MSRRGGHNRTVFTDTQVELLRGQATHKALARAFGTSDMPIRNWRKAHGWSAQGVRPVAPVQAPLGKSGRVDTPDGSTVTSPPISRAVIEAAGGAEAYLRERWGFPEAEWLCVSATGNEWLAQKAGGDTLLLGQVKGSFRKVADLAAVLPAPAAWTGPRYSAPKPSSTQHAWRAYVTADHQAPYHDEAKHAAVCAALRDIAPEQVLHLGDGPDYTNVSKHQDHAVVKASVDECTDAWVGILADMRAAAPTARFRILPGNHCVRPLSELLMRAERMAGIRSGNLPDSPGSPLLALSSLWRLNELGIELVDDPRGWQHAEIVVVPGLRGLVATHGYLTGKNVAARTLEARGRSVIVGHTHRREHVFAWNAALGCEQQAAVVGCSCEQRGGGGKSFPTFVANDVWTAGDMVVSVQEDGAFTLEHVLWDGVTLRWRDKAWA